MTIKKAHGQSLNYVGVYLPQPAFGHGQLCVYYCGTQTSSRYQEKFNKDDPGKCNIVYKSIQQSEE
jgi:hypothetical protein